MRKKVKKHFHPKRLKYQFFFFFLANLGFNANRPQIGSVSIPFELTGSDLIIISAYFFFFQFSMIHVVENRRAFEFYGYSF